MRTRSASLPPALHWPSRTLSGPGCLRHLWEEGFAFGETGLLVHGRSLLSSGRLDVLMRHLPPGRKMVTHLHEEGEPTLVQLDRLRSTAHAARVDWVASVGGGSVVDLGKGVAGLAHAEDPSVLYHDGKAPPSKTVPFMAAPSTAGTGAEATPVCVFTNEATGVKKSFRHPAMLARTVLLDPELLEEAPRTVIAASGMDALTQAVESMLSKRATPFTRQISLMALELIGGALLPTYEGHRAACGDLLQGSYLAGIALAHARLGLVHGLAHPLGAHHHVGHGLACAACLPFVLRYNREACGRDYDQIAQRLGAPLESFVTDAIARMRLENPFAGRMPENLDAIVAETLASGSSAANPRPVTAGDVHHILYEIHHPQPPEG